MALSGWKRVRTSSGKVRYRNPSGRVVTRSQYDNARARADGYRNYYHYRQTRKKSDYIRWQKDYIANKNAKRSDFFLGSTFSKKYQAAAKAKGKDRRRADGPLADFLVELGLRDESWEWDVGDTPQGTGD